MQFRKHQKGEKKNLLSKFLMDYDHEHHPTVITKEIYSSNIWIFLVLE